MCHGRNLADRPEFRPMAARAGSRIKLPIAWKMIYEYRRVVAFVTLGTRRRGQIGRSGGNVSARLDAVLPEQS